MKNLLNKLSKINWIVRFKNPVFVFQLVLSILTPILAYMGINLEDLTTWGKLGEVIFGAISNPYILGLIVVNVYNAIIDPTTKGIADSKQALTYTKPKE